MKKKIIFILFIILLIIGFFVYLKYFFTEEAKNISKRTLQTTFGGQNLTITIFSYEGKIIKRWTNVRKITAGRTASGSGERNYTYFYTSDNRYVQIPDSVWYIAEEAKE